MKIQSKELKEFIEATLQAVDDGLSSHTHYELTGAISFSLAVVNKQEKSGGLKIYVTTAGAKFRKEEISKIEFKVRPKKKN